MLLHSVHDKKRNSVTSSFKYIGKIEELNVKQEVSNCNFPLYQQWFSVCLEAHMICVEV